MDRLKKSSGPFVNSIHTQRSILNDDLLAATRSRSTAVDSSLMRQIDKVEFYIRRLRCYWTAVAGDLGPLVWANPRNKYRQIWEKEISAADSKLERLMGQISKTPRRSNPKPNMDRRLQEDILKVEIYAMEAEARRKKTLKRKLTRQRAKERLSTMGASPWNCWSSSESSHPLGNNKRLVTKIKNQNRPNEILALG